MTTPQDVYREELSKYDQSQFNSIKLSVGTPMEKPSEDFLDFEGLSYVKLLRATKRKPLFLCCCCACYNTDRKAHVWKIRDKEGNLVGKIEDIRSVKYFTCIGSRTCHYYVKNKDGVMLNQILDSNSCCVMCDSAIHWGSDCMPMMDKDGNYAGASYEYKQCNPISKIVNVKRKINDTWVKLPEEVTFYDSRLCMVNDYDLGPIDSNIIYELAVGGAEAKGNRAAEYCHDQNIEPKRFDIYEVFQDVTDTKRILAGNITRWKDPNKGVDVYFPETATSVQKVQLLLMANFWDLLFLYREVSGTPLGRWDLLK